MLNSTTPSRALLCGLLLYALLLPACASRGIVEGPAYPSEKPQARALDIQVFRSSTKITFTNTTAQSYPACRMWLNAWYSREIPPLGIGESLTLNLRTFKDEFGESFRAGGFFAGKRPTRLVLAQLERDDHLLGLIVVAAAED